MGDIRRTSNSRRSHPPSPSQYPAYYPAAPQAMPVPLPALIDHHHRMGSSRHGPVMDGWTCYAYHM